MPVLDRVGEDHLEWFQQNGTPVHYAGVGRKSWNYNFQNSTRQCGYIQQASRPQI